jgi:HEAT repeat protein
LCTFAVLLLGPLAPSARGQALDPVEELRVLLSAKVSLDENPDALKRRADDLQEASANLKTVNDLRRALALSEWKDDYISPKVAAIDLKVRQGIGARLTKTLQFAVEQGDTSAGVAAARLIGEIGISIRALKPGDRSGMGRSLAPLLIQLMQKKDPLVRQEAARALGRINPAPKEAGAAFNKLLDSPLPADRRAAGEGLTSMVTTVFQLQQKGSAKVAIEANRGDLISAAAEAVPAAGRCLRDSDVVVRRFGADALQQAGLVLRSQIDPYELPELPQSGRKWSVAETKRVQEARASVKATNDLIRPLVNAVKDQADALAAGLVDPDLEVRVLSRRALDQIGTARLRIVRWEENLPVPAGSPEPKSEGKEPTDTLYFAIKPAVQVIARRAFDNNIEVRRATLDFLEALESGAIPAIRVIAAGLRDPDRFVRWAAARTLAKIGPVEPQLTVPLLAQLLRPGEDPDVREMAATTLRRYGIVAKASLPTLISASTVGDPVSRESIIKAIISVGGPDAVAAVPALRQSLQAKYAPVRRAAADALGSLGPLAQPAVDDLQALLEDEDAAVRTAASEAILSIRAQQAK